MGETKTKKSQFTLPEGVVTVKFIKRKKGMASNVGDNHVISGGMLTNSKKTFSAPLQNNGAIANVLNKEEKEYIEDLTGLNLSVYGDFWKTYTVDLFKDDASNKFDLSNPMDYMSIQLLKCLKNDIAVKWADRNNKQTYQFAIITDDEIPNEKKAKLDIKKEAFKLYGKIEDDRDMLIGVLKLIDNSPISKDSKLTWVQGKVEEIVDTTPEIFVKLMKDESLSTKLLIHKGIEKKIVVRNGNKFSTVDGLELAENGQNPSFVNAVKYLDNPKHQEVRDLIEARINS